MCEREVERLLYRDTFHQLFGLHVFDVWFNKRFKQQAAYLWDGELAKKRPESRDDGVESHNCQ